MFLAVLIFATAFIIRAQKVDFEKTYEVDAKAKRGYLDDVIVNQNDKTTCLSFVTRATGNFTGSKVKVKYQDYYFDADYNFKEVKEYEEDYKNKKFKGENYTIEGISVEPNLMGDIVLRKKKVDYTWSWLNRRYYKKVTLLDKVKPKDESGNKYTLVKKFENDETGEVIALVRARPTKVGKTWSQPNMLEHFLLKIDQNLNFEITDQATLTSFKTVTKAYIIPAENSEQAEPGDEDISNADVCFIFASSKGGDKEAEDPHDYEIWRVSKLGKILGRTENFKVKASAWNIEQLIAQDGSIYLVGPANDGKFCSQITDPDNTKWEFYQLLKVKNDKVIYNTTTSMDDFEAKLKKPASQKKNPAYKGKRFDFNQANVTTDGSIFICGQNKTKEGEYQDVLMFYFDNVGILKAQYGVRLEEVNDASKKNATTQYMNFTKDNAYWTVCELMGFKEEAGKGERPKALIYPNIAKINLATGEINDFVKIGSVKDKPTYFLQNDFPFIPNPADGSQIYLGLNKKGNIFWFGKVAFE